MTQVRTNNSEKLISLHYPSQPICTLAFAFQRARIHYHKGDRMKRTLRTLGLLIITVLLTVGLAQQTQQTQETGQQTQQTQQQQQQFGQDQQLTDMLMELRQIQNELGQLINELEGQLGFPTTRDLEERIGGLERGARVGALQQARRDLRDVRADIEAGEQPEVTAREVARIRSFLFPYYQGVTGEERQRATELEEQFRMLEEQVRTGAAEAQTTLEETTGRLEQEIERGQQEIEQQQQTQRARQGAEAGRTVLQVGDRTMTEREFDRRFDLAIRGMAAQQGIPINEQTRALFDQFRPDYLEQLATEQVLLQEAQTRGLTPTDEEVNQQVEEIRGGFENEEAFNQFLTDVGFENEEAFRNYIREQEALQRTVEELGRDIEVTDEQIQTFYQENQERIGQPLENVRDQVRTVLEREQLNERINELRQGVDVQTYPENLGPQFQGDGEGTTGGGN